MKHPFNPLSIAREIKAVQDQCRQIEPLTSRLKDFGHAEAYAVADLIHHMRMQEGAIPVGRKNGFTNPEMWSIYGVSEPIWGYVYDTSSDMILRTAPQKKPSVYCKKWAHRAGLKGRGV
jgi:2-oxo-3-hexenedioate decarboxylase